jgi:ferrochelatase
VAPIGFLCDHVEVLYDLDIEAQQKARELGIRVHRVATLGAHPAFIRALADAVERALVGG